MKITVQDNLVALRLPPGDGGAKILVLQERAAVMELGHDENAAARDAITGEKGHLLRDGGVRSRVRVVQRNDEVTGGGISHAASVWTGRRKRARFLASRALQKCRAPDRVLPKTSEYGKMPLFPCST